MFKTSKVHKRLHEGCVKKKVLRVSLNFLTCVKCAQKQAHRHVRKNKLIDIEVRTARKLKDEKQYRVHTASDPSTLAGNGGQIV